MRTADAGDTIRQIHERFQTAVLLVEQNVNEALRIAESVYVLEEGRMVFHTVPQKAGWTPTGLHLVGASPEDRAKIRAAARRERCSAEKHNPVGDCWQRRALWVATRS